MADHSLIELARQASGRLTLTFPVGYEPDPEFEEAIAIHKHLHRVSIRGYGGSMECALAGLARNPHVRSVRIHGLYCDSNVNLLSILENTNLRTLHLSGCFGPEVIDSHFMKAVNDSRLRHLSLTDMYAGKVYTGMVNLLMASLHDVTLKYLHISTYVQQVADTPHFLDFLARNPNLEALNLKGYGLRISVHDLRKIQNEMGIRWFNDVDVRNPMGPLRTPKSDKSSMTLQTQSVLRQILNMS